MAADPRLPTLATPPDDGPRPIARALTLALLVLIAAGLSAGIVGYSYRVAAAVVGLSLGAVILWNPFVGLIALIASLPFETAGMLGDPNAPGAVSIMKLAGLATFGGLFFDTLGRRRPVVFGRVFHPLSLLTALFAFITLGAALVHPTEESLRETVRIFTILVFVLVTLHLIDTPQRLRAAVTASIVVATGVAAYSLVQRKFGATTGSEEWQPLAGTIIDVGEEELGVMRRAAGPFTHPVWLALYLSLTLPLTLMRCWITPRGWAKFAWIAAAGLQVAGVVVTYSRMGYLAVAGGAALILLRRRGGPVLLGLALAATLATVPLWPETLKARITSILDYRQSSSSITRIGQQLVGWWMFRDSPITGVGPGNFENNVRRYADRVSDTLRIEAIAAHNMYVQVLAELGLPGALTLVALLWVGWRAAERARRNARDPDLALTLEALSVSVVVFVCSAVLIHATYQKEWWLLLAFVAAADWLTRPGAAALRRTP